jgi:hypothetical protein
MSLKSLALSHQALLCCQSARCESDDTFPGQAITKRNGDHCMVGQTRPTTDGDIPIGVFDERTKSQLRRPVCTIGFVGAEFHQLVLDTLAACTNLVGLRIAHVERWFRKRDPAGSAVATWINRLRIYHPHPRRVSFAPQHSTGAILSWHSSQTCRGCRFRVPASFPCCGRRITSRRHIGL